MHNHEYISFVLFIVFAIGCNIAVLSYDALAEDQLHNPAAPGHWYDRACCSLQDCRPASPGDVKVTPFGYNVMGKFVGFADESVRQTKAPFDPRYHICQNKYTKGIICLYVPASGF